jgi:hypothetical protein
MTTLLCSAEAWLDATRNLTIDQFIETTLAAINEPIDVEELMPAELPAAFNPDQFDR